MKYFKATTPDGTIRTRQSNTREYIAATWCNEVVNTERGEDGQYKVNPNKQFIYGFSVSANPSLDKYWKRGEWGVVKAFEITKAEYIKLNHTDER